MDSDSNMENNLDLSYLYDETMTPISFEHDNEFIFQNALDNVSTSDFLSNVEDFDLSCYLNSDEDKDCVENQVLGKLESIFDNKYSDSTALTTDEIMTDYVVYSLESEKSSASASTLSDIIFTSIDGETDSSDSMMSVEQPISKLANPNELIINGYGSSARNFFETFAVVEGLQNIHEADHNKSISPNDEILTAISNLKKYDFDDALKIFTFEEWENQLTKKTYTKITDSIKRNMFRYIIRQGNLLQGYYIKTWKNFLSLIPEAKKVGLQTQTINVHWRQSILKKNCDNALLVLALQSNIDISYAKLFSLLAQGKIKPDCCISVLVNPLQEGHRFEEFLNRIREIEEENGLICKNVPTDDVLA